MTGQDPFGGMPFFGDLARLIGQQGPVSWDAATQLALSIATEAQAEPNVDPLERIRLEQLARAAEVQLSGSTGLDTSPGGRVVTIEPITRSQWVQRTLAAFRPRFESIATALGSSPGSERGAGGAAGPAEATTEAEPLDPAFRGLEDLAGLGSELDQPAGQSGDEPDEEAWISGLLQLLGPMMLGMTAGSLVGHLARRSFGWYDLPIPRPEGGLVIVPATLDEFGHDWSLDDDDLRLWVCLHELTCHAVLGVPHVRDRLDRLLTDYAAGFRPDPDAFERNLGQLDPSQADSLQGFQRLLGDPEVLLGAVTTPQQAALRAEIDALIVPLVGYVDAVMDHIGTRLIGTYRMVSEAVRRRRVEAGDADRFVERLFGLELGQDLYDRGAAFTSGVVERAGFETLDRLWRTPASLPTRAEVAAPGLWLARIELAS